MISAAFSPDVARRRAEPCASKGFARLRRRPMGSKLPQNRGPWTVTGVIGPDRSPPHNFPHDAIEEAINVEGFQLWRLDKTTEARPIRAGCGELRRWEMQLGPRAAGIFSKRSARRFLGNAAIEFGFEFRSADHREQSESTVVHRSPWSQRVMREFCGIPKAWFRCGSSRTSQRRVMISRSACD